MSDLDGIPDVTHTGPWSVSDVARHLDVSYITVSRLRHGKRQPSMRIMRLINDKLGWRFSAQAKLLNNPDRTAWAAEFQDFLNVNFHVPKVTIKRGKP